MFQMSKMYEKMLTWDKGNEGGEMNKGCDIRKPKKNNVKKQEGLNGNHLGTSTCNRKMD